MVVGQSVSGIEPVPRHADRNTDEALFSQLEASLGHLVRRTQQLQTQYWAETVESVTGAQYAILTVIAAYPNAGRTELEQLAALDRSTSADVIARLRTNSWIERERTISDGRRSALKLTPPSRAALPSITVQVDVVQQRLMHPLAHGERSDLIRLLAMVAYGDAPRLRAAEPTRPGAPVLDLATTPTHLLRRAEQRHQRLWSALVEGLATPTQYAVMCALRRDTLDQKTVSALASLDTSTAADVISRLRRQSLLVVSPDEGDRRRNLVRLAPSAFELLADLTPRAESVHQELCSPLTDDEAALLRRLLRSISFVSRASISHSG